MWVEELKGDIEEEFIINGIKCGFDIVNRDCAAESVSCKNYKSATSPPLREAVDKQIMKEIELGRYKICAEKPLVVSALGAIPKGESGKIRLIHDCSRPAGKSVNDYSTPPKVSFDTIDGAIKTMTE